MNCSKIIIGVLLIATIQAAQAFLGKETSPITIQLTRKDMGPDFHRELTTFLTTKQMQIGNPDLNASFLQTAQSKVALKNFMNTQWVGCIGLGTPPQYFDAILDTGSANFWVNSKRCTDEGCTAHKAYDSSLSSTYSEESMYIEVEFGTGDVSGELNKETVTFGGIVVNQQGFGEILDETGDVFLAGMFEAIVGLAFPAMAPQGFIPLFDGLMSSGHLPKNQISFYYSLDETVESSVTVGGSDPTKFTGAISWIPVVEEYYWLIKIDDVLIGDKSLGLCEHGCVGAVDTGTSLLTAPSDTLYELIKAQDLDNNCQHFRTLPPLVFIIGGKRYHLAPEKYILTVAHETEEDPGTHSITPEACLMAIMPLDVPGYNGLWILGDIFLSQYYTIFDRDTNSVGFGEAKV